MMTDVYQAINRGLATQSLYLYFLKIAFYVTCQKGQNLNAG